MNEKAKRFRTLHHAEDVLVLPNAWDVATAVLMERAGFGAVGTTSAGMAALYGYPDAEGMTCDEMLALVKRMVTAIDVPLSADIEAGYGDVTATVAAVAAVGVAGINLEDAELSQEEAVAHIASARAADTEIVINARTDGYWLGRGDYDDTVRRGNAYLKAGADCVFVPLVQDPETIARLVRDIEGPVNLLAGPTAPTVPEMKTLGVARVSVGSAIARACLRLVRDAAEELRKEGTYRFSDNAIPYPEVNALLRR